MIKWYFFQGGKDGPKSANQCDHHINKMKNKNHVIISIDEEKAFDKTQYLVMTKIITKWEQRECAFHNKDHI